MKKLLIVLLAALLLFSCAAGYASMKKNASAPAQPEPQPAAAAENETPAEEGTTTVSYMTIDRDALYALHEGSEVVARIGDRDVTWDEYYYWLSYGASSVENYLMQMSLYGGSVSWESPWGDDPDQSFFDYVFYSAEENLKPFVAIEALAEENGVTLDEEQEAALAEQLAKYRVQAVGENATDEEYAAHLHDAESLSLGTLETLMRDSALYQACFTAIYGKDGALVSDEETADYLTETGYWNANHILRTTKNESGEALSEEEQAQKQAEAAAIAAQLQAAKDPEELLALLAELKEQWDEDTGKTQYPNGYVFKAGEMEEFENTVKSLQEYQVSDPVQSQFGYHVIVRLPLDPDTVVGYSSEGTAITARAACANTRYGQLLDQRLSDMKLVFVPGFEKPDLSSLLVENSF